MHFQLCFLHHKLPFFFGSSTFYFIFRCLLLWKKSRHLFKGGEKALQDSGAEEQNSCGDCVKISRASKKIAHRSIFPSWFTFGWKFKFRLSLSVCVWGSSSHKFCGVLFTFCWTFHPLRLPVRRQGWYTILNTCKGEGYGWGQMGCKWDCHYLMARQRSWCLTHKWQVQAYECGGLIVSRPIAHVDF